MLAFPDCQMLDVTGPLQMFAGVNDELGRQAYELVIAAPKRGPFKTSSGIGLLVADLAIADVSPAKCRASDTLIVAGGDPGLCRALESGEIAALIKAARRRGARIVSICTGTFFLAAAGLLDGRRAATHWRSVERLRRFRPQVDVDPEAIYLRDGDVWTSAGVTAGIDLALALIEADFGRAIALAVARRHVVFRIRPGGQGQFSPELAAQGIRHHRLSKLAEKIAEGPQEDWRTDTLAAEAGVSLRSLSRLFRKELNASPSQPNLVGEARKYSGLAVDTLVELTKTKYSGSTRYNAATALLDRGYGRPAQSLDLHLSADAITKRLSDMTDAELAALEARMIAAAPIVLEATAEVSDDAGELPDGDVEDSPPDALA
jgi:transcriptional regulator GlxA family with amidase domain